MTRLLMMVCLLIVPATAAAQDVDVDVDEALLVGSSSVNGAVGRTLERELEAFGVNLTRRSRSASGFARPDFYDWEAQVPDLGPIDRYRLILVYAGGNDVQSLRLREDEYEPGDDSWVRWQDEDRWRTVYATRVREFVDLLCAEGAQRVAVVLPVNGGRPRWSDRIVRVREAQAMGARASLCGVAIDAGPDMFPARDGVHLTWRGARRMWTRIKSPLLVALGHEGEGETLDSIRRE